MTFELSLKSLALALTAVAVIVAADALAFAGPSKGNPAAGKAIFVVRCVACHKADGTGGIKLTGNPTPNWKDPKYVNNPKWNDDYLRDCITNGKLKSGMVDFGKSGQLKPAQIEDLIAYIRTLAAKKAPAKTK
jgi:mono/diheme cytochrome c family protein